MNKLKCPECGSQNIIKSGKQTRVLKVLEDGAKIRGKVQRYQCKEENCLRYFTPKEEK